MISDLTRLAAAIDAVSDPAPNVDLAALDREVQALTTEQREIIRGQLTEHGCATISLNGSRVVLQLRYRTPHRP